MKTLLVHDTFLMKGGAERMNIEIAKILEADIATAVWNPDCYNPRLMGWHGNRIPMDVRFSRGMLGFFRMKLAFMTSRVTRGYERIFLSNEAISTIWGVSRDTPTYYYAHSLPRHLYDLYYDYLAKVPLLMKPLYILGAMFYRALYRHEIGRVRTVFVNSLANQERMKNWFGRTDTILIYPPVDMRYFRAYTDAQIIENVSINKMDMVYKGYYLSFARLTSNKRIDTIIRAFQRMPSERVVIIYGENDTDKNKLMELAAIDTHRDLIEGRCSTSSRYPNIIFLKLINNERLPYVIAGAIATICVSKNEDFGMVAIESMSCGVPVIAVDEGGYRETMVAGETGYLISPDDIEGGIESVITKTPKETFANMSKACRIRVVDFSVDSFARKLKMYL